MDDPNGGYYDKDDHATISYGHAARGAERERIATLVLRYFAALAAHDGPAACASIDQTLANGLAPQHPTRRPEDSSRMTEAEACAAGISTLLENLPARTDILGARVVGVRERGNSAIVLLRSRNSEARYLPVAREHGAWKIQALLDSVLA